jgi:ectoine hydroxylase-related dioxygenase (phytanoyl-CoA dioxygenase family)
MSTTLEPIITNFQRQQFRDEGYFILERAVPDDHLQILRDSCDHLMRLADEELDRLGVDHNHITHRGVRYHIAKKYDQAPRLRKFVFGELMAEICKATIGENAWLFYDQYVVKCAEKGIRFSWHQDSGYLGFPHRPYVTCWTAVDDMTLANGTAYVLPFSAVGIRTLVEHIRDPQTGDKTGYFGREEGVPAIVPAGSVVVFSSLSFHRSGANTTNHMRRAYVTQYSPAPILKPDGSGPMHLAVPFLKDGRRVNAG